MTRPALAALVVMGLAAGCAQQPRPAVGPLKTAPPRRGVEALKADLASCYRAPAFQNAVWGVLVKSLKTGETLYALNPATLLMPASNMKVVTMAAAAERLGWDFTFKTTVVATGPVEGGVLKGDLVVVGGGDPSLGGRPTEVRLLLNGGRISFAREASHASRAESSATTTPSMTKASAGAGRGTTSPMAMRLQSAGSTSTRTWSG